MNDDRSSDMGAVEELPESCPICGSTLDIIIADPNPMTLSETGRRCLRCGWSLVGTHVPLLWFDENRYEVCLPKTDSPSAQILRLMNREMGLGFAQAKANIQANDIIIFSGNAREVYEYRERLDHDGVRYYVKPYFGYRSRTEVHPSLRKSDD